MMTVYTLYTLSAIFTSECLNLCKTDLTDGNSRSMMTLEGSRIMKAIPAWAGRIVADVTTEAERPYPPIVVWRRGRGTYSSGGAERDRIVVTAGTSRADQKIVLLHELAHWLTSGAHHNPTFWIEAWRLFLRYKLPIRATMHRECASHSRRRVRQAYLVARRTAEGQS